ncbi:glycosyltransferase family 2 protein [Pedobacter mucosus]|uniref:glycosyltransferase family 2 protein n=1 Tax=Pedobacter mucosus TaxID=2895286 RepID=UPI001EE3E1AE|nr:glycosyltransferase family 2 protein [Pedobacter mucosus]UKT63250.1 glycosyltransferase [Pedobacter mucosus]
MSRKEPKISILIVVYNAVEHLEQSLLSVIKQAYSNVELIVIDGNSTDGTVDIIRRYSDKIGYWVSEPDNGIYDAMNKAVDKATGDWIYFLGAGDILLNVLDKVIDNFKDVNTVYYGDVYRTDLLKVFNGRFSMFRSARMSICHQAIFYPNEAIKKHKFNTKYKVQADHNLNMVIQGDLAYKFEYFSAVVCIYEGGGFSAVTRDEDFFRDRLNIVRQNYPFFIYAYAYTLDKFLKLVKRGEYRNQR